MKLMLYSHQHGSSYACRTDPNSGVCGNDVISVCVSHPSPAVTAPLIHLFFSAATMETDTAPNVKLAQQLVRGIKPSRFVEKK
jgi:hypothetical protein